jgi:hypothetical protein
VLERFTNQYGTRTKTDSRITQQNANLSFTMVQATARNLALAMMSDKNTLTQTLAPPSSARSPACRSATSSTPAS